MEIKSELRDYGQKKTMNLSRLHRIDFLKDAVNKVAKRIRKREKKAIRMGKEEDVPLYSEQITVSYQNKLKEQCKQIMKDTVGEKGKWGLVLAFKKRNEMRKSVSFVTLDNFHSSHWNKILHKINNLVIFFEFQILYMLHI